LKGRRADQVDWLKLSLKEMHVPLPLKRSAGGPPGIKLKLRAKALEERQDLFTSSGFDRAWLEIPEEGF